MRDCCKTKYSRLSLQHTQTKHNKERIDLDDNKTKDITISKLMYLTILRTMALLNQAANYFSLCGKLSSSSYEAFEEYLIALNSTTFTTLIKKCGVTARII